ncbi:M15 family metallopeptidase [Thalassotalea sp. Y01]|uniref:M15 family metallopeptidase n=1 Tax=Thalassotalea sp. Y01 TaxID=2729613 RepID=UPI00145F5378|nr:M15 family metallopeptidase [Thalassotalea sp. Y01]NMP16633.1 M15 family metallopeptidase [Thalassotalea sp. Y01]
MATAHKITTEQVYGLTDEHIHWLDNGAGIHKNMLAAFNHMQRAAKAAGFNLQVASGFRNFTRQLHLVNAKLTGKRAIKNRENKVIDCSVLSELEHVQATMLFSALPGGSRHHWGTDIDVYDPDLQNQQALQLEPWEYQDNGPQAPLNRWLDANMQRFGFYRPYQDYRNGVAEEPWHLSYAPLAKIYMQAFDVSDWHQLIAASELHNKQTVLDNLDLLCQQFVVNVCPPSHPDLETSHA